MAFNHNLELQQENAYLEQYHQKLSEIQSHIFVTPDSALYRNVMEKWVNLLRSNPGMEKSVFFPTGSVAVGMVKQDRGSDIDGAVLYSCSQDQMKVVGEAINVTELPEEFNPFLVFSRVENRIDDTLGRVDDILLMGRPQMTDQTALFFAPSLLEFAVPEERKLVDSWRKEIILKLSQLPDNKGEKIWNLITKYIEQQFIHYENSDGGDQEKRVKRVNQVIKEKLIERFPNAEDRQQRAFKFIESRRNNFHYPSFAEMKLAYEII